MNKRKGIIIFICIAVLIMAGGKTYHDTKNKSTENYSEEKKDKSTEKKNETNLATNNQGKLEEISKKRTVKERLKDADVAQEKTVSSQKPEKWGNLKKGNAQTNTIIHKDLSYLEKKYLYKSDEAEIQSVDSELEKLYGYKSYEKNENAQRYYRTLDNAMKNFVDSDKDVEKQDEYYLICILDYAEYGLSKEEAINIYFIYKNDHPSYYWLSATVIVYDSQMGILTDEDYISAKLRKEYNNKIKECVKKFVADTETMNHDAKVRYIHDTIIKNTNYAYQEDGITPEDANWAHNIIGYICNKGSVCEGYAKIFQLVLNELDIGVIFVTGSGNNVDHAWNLVQMGDSKWYCIDLTWDDTPDWNEDGVSKIYFCCPKSIFSDTHIENTTQSAVGKYLYDLPETSNEFTYYCANADNALEATDSTDIMSEAIDKTKTEVEKGNNCVIFNVKNEISEKFVKTLFSRVEEINDKITFYQKFMDSCPETVGKVAKVKYMKVGCRYYIFFQAKDSVKPIVTLKKNNKKVGNYMTLTEAFSVMTDSTADYKIEMINNVENLVFPIHANFPKVNSLTIIGCAIPYNNSYVISRILLSENLSISEDFYVKNLAIQNMGYNASVTINVAAIKFTVFGNGFETGGFTWEGGKEPVIVQGEKGSKLIVEKEGKVEFNNSVSFDRLILKKGTVLLRGKQNDFRTIETVEETGHNLSESRRISFANINKRMTLNIGEIFNGAEELSFDTMGTNVINIDGDIHGGCNFEVTPCFGKSQINIKSRVSSSFGISYVIPNWISETEAKESLFQSYMYAPNVDEKMIDFGIWKIENYNHDDYKLKKDQEGNVRLTKYENITKDNYVYRKLSDGTCELVEDNRNNNGVITIPASIEGYTVSKISEELLRKSKSFLCDEDNPFFVVEEGILYSKDKKILYRYTSSDTKAVYDINNKTEIIKKEAFYDNKFIKKIIIPDSVKKIEQGFVCECSSLEKISVNEKNLYYSSKDGVLFDKEMKTLLFYPNNKADTNYEMPDTVQKIESNAIYSDNIKVFKVNENCQYIEVGAFQVYEKLEKLYLPDSLVWISYRLCGATIYASSYKVAYDFAISKGLSFVLIQGKILPPADLNIQTTQNKVLLKWSRSSQAEKYQIYRKKLGSGGYDYLDTTKEIKYIDNSVITGKEYSYYLVAIFNNSDEIEYSEPSKEVSIVVSDKVILDEEGYDIQGIIYSLDENTKTAQVGLKEYANNTSQYKGIGDGKVIIPSRVEQDGVEYRVNKIGDYAFYKNQGLKKIIISEGIEYIGKSAFADAGDFNRDLEIPKSVEKIEPGAFAYSQLKNIYVDKENKYYSSKEGVLFSKDETILIWCPIGGYTSTYIIPDSVVEIESYAFQRSFYSKVYFPDNLKKIGEEAFAGSSIKSIELKNVVEIGRYAFAGCIELEYINLGRKMETIGFYSFGQCDKLKGVYIPDSVKVIEECAFEKCYDLKYVVGCKNVEFTSSFVEHCSKLELFMIPENTNLLPMDAIRGCSSLKKIYVPETVEKIDSYSFRECAENLIIYGKSKAMETYATDNSLNFKNIEEHKHDLEWIVLEKKVDEKQELKVHKCSMCDYVDDIVTTQLTQHDWGKWEIIKKASCEENGIRRRVCSECGEVDEQIIEIGGHKYGKARFEWGENHEYCIITIPCENEGCEEIAEYYCVADIHIEKGLDNAHSRKVYEVRVSHYYRYYVDTYEEIVHVEGEENVENLVEATCEKSGSYEKVIKCKICNTEISRKKCSIPANGHKWKEEEYTVIKEPTCTENGLKGYQCAVEGCKATKEEKIEPLGHDISDEWTIDKKATCIEEGEKSHHCKRNMCKYREDIKKIAFAEHSWEKDKYMVIEEPTCINTGLKKYQCMVEGCEATKEEIIEPLGHDISDEWTVDKESTCIEEGEKSHHCKREDCDYKTDVTKLSLADHTWSKKSYINVNPTCTTKGVREYRCTLYGCNAYKEEDIEALGHDMSPNWTIDKRATCIEKGEKSHHCMRRPCAYREDVTEIEYTEHLWRGIYTVIEEPTCTKEGLKRDKCKVCREFKDEKIEALGHDISDEWTVDKNATCAEEGEKSHHCRRKECEEREDITVIPTTEKHIYDSGKIILKPNYTQKGIKLYICTYCKHEYRESIPELKNIPGKGRKIVDTKNQTEYIVTKAAVYGAEAAYAKAINKNITSVIIPAEVTIDGINYKVTSISKGAFQNNKKVKKIIIGKNIKTIGDNAFSNCNKLKQVSMGNNVITIGNKAFYKCNSLIKFTFPISVRKIGKQAFSGCKNLKMIIINTPYLTKKSVGAKAFKGIHAKATIKVPKKQKKAYQKFLKSKGIGKKVKIK